MSMEDAIRAANEARAKRAAARLAADGKTDAQRAAEEKAKAAAYHKKDVVEERKQFVELKRIHDRVRAADLDSWYDALRDFTYRTVFVPISADVLDTFLSSERVYEDLTLAREHVKHTPWGQKFVLRAWTAVPIEYEFRGFVYGNKLTALSQYYHYCHFPELVARKHHILQLVQAFFETLKDKVPLQPKEYVVDFAVDVSAGRVYVIELNPFGTYEGMGTSCAMFDKRKDADAAVLFGQSPFEFRIETQPHAEVFKKMTDAWKDLFIAEGHLPPAGHTAAAAAAATTTTTPAAAPSKKL